MATCRDSGGGYHLGQQRTAAMARWAWHRC